MLLQSISKNSIILSVFAVATAGLLAWTNASTEDRRIMAKKQALEKALNEIIDSSHYSNNLLTDTVMVSGAQLGLKTEKKAYLAWQESEPYAVILPATSDEGYGGSIHLIVGIYYDGRVAGVRIVPPHNETPGLGDNIEIKKSDWPLSFNNRSLDDPGEEGWKVKKDGGEFDQFTGATITPRAVVKAVHKALKYFADHKKDLFLASNRNRN